MREKIGLHAVDERRPSPAPATVLPASFPCHATSTSPAPCWLTVCATHQVDVCPGGTPVQQLRQGGDALPRKVRPKPGPHIQRPELRQVPLRHEALARVRLAHPQLLPVQDHAVPIARELHVALKRGEPLAQGQIKCGHCVFWCVGAVASVSDDAEGTRPVHGGTAARMWWGQWAMHNGRHRRQRG